MIQVTIPKIMGQIRGCQYEAEDEYDFHYVFETKEKLREVLEIHKNLVK